MPCCPLAYSKGRAIALLPIGVFLTIYLGLGLLFEYGLKIPMGFYKIPIVIAFLAAILTACLQNRSVSFDQKLEWMAQGVGDKNIITMLLIFMTAGAFVGVVGNSSAQSVAYFMLSVIDAKYAVAVLFVVACFVSTAMGMTAGAFVGVVGNSSAQSVAYFMLSVIDAKYAVAVLFVVACFVSTAMGTSVGTITLLTPIAVEVALSSELSVALCVGTIVGGAMFGDNLSFISDTTIAACNGQGCPMRDKFKGNFFIALPAALLTLAVILLLTGTESVQSVDRPYELIQILPYVLVLLGGIAGINVFLVLLAGIVSGSRADPDPSLCAGAAGGHRRDQCIPRAVGRHRLRLDHHVGYGEDPDDGSSEQHGFRRWGNV